MKKIIIIAIMLLLVFSLFGEELNDYAQVIKEGTDVYNPIKEYAIAEWGNNADLVIKEINRQCMSLYKALEVVSIYTEVPAFRELLTERIGQVMNEGVLVDWYEVLKEMEEIADAL